MITFGLENEIGIDRDNESQLDVVAESIDLVRQAKDFGAFMRWDYHFEDPHRDMRGFRVDSLRQDTDEAYYHFYKLNRSTCNFQSVHHLVVALFYSQPPARTA